MLERRGHLMYDYTLHEADRPVRMQWHFLNESKLPVAIQTWELAPGTTEGMHTHELEDRPKDEVYLVTEGTGRMTVGNHTYDLAPGDAVLASAGVPHDLVNTGEGTLRVIVVWGYHADADYSQYGVTNAARNRRALAP